jgi:Spt4/RpoE2 zinc finger
MVEPLSNVVPADQKTMRACLVCSLVKTAQQFEHDGCSNCNFLKMKHDRHRVLDCTSSSFEGYLLFIFSLSNSLELSRHLANTLKLVHSRSVKLFSPELCVLSFFRRFSPSSSSAFFFSSLTSLAMSSLSLSLVD